MAIDDLDDAAARRLVFAMTVAALKDHRRGDEEATAWLEHDCLTWLEMAGLPCNESGLRRALEGDVSLRRSILAGEDWRTFHR